MTDDESTRFDRVTATGGDDVTPSRESIEAWWDERFGIEAAVFEGLTFWERGRGNIWCVRGDFPTPVRTEGLGLVCLRTRGRHWKPTSNAAQRFGHAATRNVITLDARQTDRFVGGETQALPWDGDWGYLLAATAVAGERTVLGVGQYIDGDLRSVVPKGRRRELLRADGGRGP